MTIDTYLRGLDVPGQWSEIFRRLLENHHLESPLSTPEDDQAHIDFILWGLYSAGVVWRLGGRFVLPPVDNLEDFIIRLEFGILRHKGGGPTKLYAERV